MSTIAELVRANFREELVRWYRYRSSSSCRLMSCMSIHLPHDAIRVTVFFGGCSDSTMSFSATELSGT